MRATDAFLASQCTCFMPPEMAAQRDSYAHASKEVRFICSLLGKQRFASNLPEAHLYIDPRLLDRYKVNLHLTEPDGQVQEAAREQMVSFASKKTADSTYLCTIFLQKPEDKMWAVSAYLMETYLGRYALRNNWYFRDGNYRSASRCFEHVVDIVNETKEEMRKTETQQSRLPYLLKFKLAAVHGEIEEKVHSVAEYLSPDNVQPMADPRTPYATFVTPVKSSPPVAKPAYQTRPAYKPKSNEDIGKLFGKSHSSLQDFVKNQMTSGKKNVK